jgi:hypothetical protein
MSRSIPAPASYSGVPGRGPICAMAMMTLFFPPKQSNTISHLFTPDRWPETSAVDFAGVLGSAMHL